MSKARNRYAIVSVAVLSLMISAAAFITARAAYSQKGSEVATREPGSRLLGEPQPIQAEALKHVEFAWLSEAAYNRIASAKTAPSSGGHEQCMEADAALHTGGWEKWSDFPEDGLKQKILESNLRVEV